jgi:hypothetical protein
MKIENKISYSGYLIFFFGTILLIYAFLTNIDGYGKALSGDFRDTWPYVLELTKNFWIDPSNWTLHFPLHYYLLSKIYLITESQKITRLIFLLISFTAPILFYLNLKLKYSNKNILFILSTLIFFTPSYVYSAVWANDNNLSYILMLLGTLFHIKQLNEKIYTKKILYIYLTLFFFALVCYSRQYFAILYGFFIINFYQKISLKDSIKISFFSLFLALPGIFFLYSFPLMYGKLAFSGNIFNTILGNITTLSVYTLPVFLINLIFNKSLILNFKLYKFLVPLILFLITILFHDIKYMGQNGGVFLIFSNKFFNNLYPFYILFFINLICIFLIFEKKIDLFIIFSITILISGIIVLQKYFEPLFFIFFFLFSISKFKNIFLTNYKACLLLIFYHFLYSFIAISNILHKI